MPITRQQYSRTATRSARDAMALALTRHLESLQFQLSGATFQLATVFSEWPAYLDRYVPPCACVLPNEWRYSDWAFTPKLLEDTWEVPGEPGFGLYKLSEIETDFEISLRTNNPAERDAMINGIEESFVAANVLMDEAQGPRYGIILPLPEYYGLAARFALQSARVIDDEERTMREQRDAVLTISSQAPQVRVGPVFPLNLKIRLTIDGEERS